MLSLEEKLPVAVRPNVPVAVIELVFPTVAETASVADTLATFTPAVSKPNEPASVVAFEVLLAVADRAIAPAVTVAVLPMVAAVVVLALILAAATPTDTPTATALLFASAFCLVLFTAVMAMLPTMATVEALPISAVTEV